MTVNVALIGVGYWGPNLARNLGASLHTVCDTRPEALKAMKCRTSTDVQAVLKDPEIHAVVVATPAATHYEIALAALKAGKHVMVEKPMARTSREALELVKAAEDRKLVLMSAHVFVFNAAVRKVKEYIDSGVLGDIHYVYSQRLNLGIIRRDVNAMWNLAPHDVSILNYWLGAAPTAASARGFSYIQPGVEDVVFMTLDYPRGVAAHVHLSWLDPSKVRRMTVVGSKKMVVYDDVNADTRLMLYDKGVTKKSLEGDGPSLGRYSTFDEFQLLVRAGDVLIPKVDFVEPLKLECEHFIECVREGRKPLTDGRDGLGVVQALEAAQRSLAGHGARVEVDRCASG